MTNNKHTQRKLYTIALIACLAIVLTYVFREPIMIGFAQGSAWIDSMGKLAPLIYILVFALAVPLFLPTIPPLLAAGMLFGLWPGALYAFAGNALGGLLAFWLSRTRVQQAVQKLLKRYDSLDALNSAIEQDGVKTAALLRMSPVIPGPILNYALGMTGLRTRDYLMASLGTVPIVVAYTFVGSTLGKFTQIGSTETLADLPASTIAVLIGGLLATIAVTVFIAKRANTLLDKRRVV